LLAGLTGLSATVAAGFAAAFALLSNPIGWAIILAGVAAALIAFFWDDLMALWNALDFTALGTAIGQGILDGLNGMSAAIRAWFTSIMPAWAGPFFDSVGGMGATGDGSMPRAPSPAGDAGARFGAGVIRPSDITQNQTVNVNAPVTVQVQQASQAPGAVGDAVAGAVNRGAQPPRMNGGMN